MSSLTQTDLDNLNKGNGLTQYQNYGYKVGRGRAVYNPSGVTADRTTGAHGMGLIIPKGSVVTRVVYKVLTTFTSPTSDTATIALSIVAANDVISAVSIATGTTWDASIPIITLVTPTISSWLTTTADSELTATVAVEAVTAGKLVVWAEWMYFGDLSLT